MFPPVNSQGKKSCGHLHPLQPADEQICFQGVPTSGENVVFGLMTYNTFCRILNSDHPQIKKLETSSQASPKLQPSLTWMGYRSVDTKLPLMVRTLLFMQSATKRVSKCASYVIPCGLFIRACNFSIFGPQAQKCECRTAWQLVATEV